MKNYLGFLACLLAGLSWPVCCAENFPGIEQLMSEHEFKNAGLDKLSDSERQALDNWLVRYTAGEAQILIHSNKEVQKMERSHETHSSLLPPFDGWSGNTRFRLENGQIWQQRKRGNYIYRGDDLRVAIRKNFLGFYTLTLISTDKSVQVKRVQ